MARCRISFRRETKGGRGKDKLGFVDVNLSEHAAGSPDSKPSSPSSSPLSAGKRGGAPETNSASSAAIADERLHSYLFRGYNNSEQRDANYILKIRIKMTLLTGDLVRRVYLWFIFTIAAFTGWQGWLSLTLTLMIRVVEFSRV